MYSNNLIFFFVSENATFPLIKPDFLDNHLTWRIVDDLNRERRFVRGCETFPVFGRCSGWIWKEDCTMGDGTQLYNTDRHVQAWRGAALCRLKLEGAVRSSPLHVCISYALFPTCRCVQSRAKPASADRCACTEFISLSSIDLLRARKAKKCAEPMNETVFAGSTTHVYARALT